jgi:integrase
MSKTAGYYVEERNNRWRCQIRYKGKTVPSETFSSEKLAHAWGKARVVEIDKGIVYGQTGKVAGTVADMIDAYCKLQYSTQKWSQTKEYGLQQLRKDLGHLPVAKLDRYAVIEYAKSLQTYPERPGIRRLGGAGIKSRLYYLVAVTQVAHDMLKDFKGAPITEVREAVRSLLADSTLVKGKARTQRPTVAQIEAIKANVSQSPRRWIDLGAMIEVLQYLPIRVGELCKIRWTDLNHEKRTVVLRSRKHPNPVIKQSNHEEVVLPTVFGVDTFKLLADREALGLADGPFAYTLAPHYDVTAVSNAFYQARARAKVEDIHMHDLRAHGISAMLAAQVPINVVASISGHKDWRVLQEHYNRMTIDEIREIIEGCCRRSGGAVTDELMAKVPLPDPSMLGHNGGPAFSIAY